MLVRSRSKVSATWVSDPVMRATMIAFVPSVLRRAGARPSDQ